MKLLARWRNRRRLVRVGHDARWVMGLVEKGTRENPLTIFDLPYKVEATGRYWFLHEGRLMELPEAVVGGVIELQEIKT